MNLNIWEPTQSTYTQTISKPSKTSSDGAKLSQLIQTGFKLEPHWPRSTWTRIGSEFRQSGVNVSSCLGWILLASYVNFHVGGTGVWHRLEQTESSSKSNSSLIKLPHWQLKPDQNWTHRTRSGAADRTESDSPTQTSSWTVSCRSATDQNIETTKTRVGTVPVHLEWRCHMINECWRRSAVSIHTNSPTLSLGDGSVLLGTSLFQGTGTEQLIPT